MNRTLFLKRVDKLRRHIAIYAKAVVLMLLRRPYKLTLLLTDGCNLSCQMCSIWRHKQTYLNLDEIRRLWSAFAVKPCWINISGGEPTLNPQLFDILSFFAAMKRSLLVTITTNGQVDITDGLTPLLKNNKKCHYLVSVSLDGERPIHDRVRGRSGSYLKANQTIARLQAIARLYPCLSVGVSTTLMNANFGTIIPFLTRRLRQVPVSVNLTQFSHYYANGSNDHFGRLPVAELKRTLRSIQYLQRRFSVDALLKMIFAEFVIQYLAGTYKPIPCTSIISNVLVTAHLDLVDCSLNFQPWISSTATRDQKLAAATEAIRVPAERMQHLRRQVQFNKCERECHTPCEAYVHIMSAFLRPSSLPKLILIYIARSFEACVLGPEHIRTTIRLGARQHQSMRRSSLPLVHTDSAIQ